MADEGYLKFQLELQPGALPAFAMAELGQVRQVLRQRAWLGQRPDGVGFGNVSVRAPEGFVISGSATGGLDTLEACHYAWVRAWDFAGNRVQAVGQIAASSESMSHAAIYAANGQVGAVLHVHSRRFFDALLAAAWPATPVECAFGTPGLALALGDVVRRGNGPAGLCLTAGHDEGIMVWGEDPERALAALIDAWQGVMEGATE